MTTGTPKNRSSQARGPYRSSLGRGLRTGSSKSSSTLGSGAPRGPRLGNSRPNPRPRGKMR